MNNESKESVHDEANYPDVFSRNSRITEILELVFDKSVTKNEMKSILLNFWSKYDTYGQEDNEEENSQDEDSEEEEDNMEFENQEEGILEVENQLEDNLEVANQEEDNFQEDQQEKDYCEFDVLCIYMLDCVYKKNGPTLSAVSRSLYCYMKCLNLSLENRIDIINSAENDFVNDLRKFTNFSSSDGEDILIDALIKCTLNPSFGLSLFLLKFGLVEIPKKANDKYKKILKKLVDIFNDILQYTFANDQAEDLIPSIELSAMLDLMTRSDINLRRSLMTFFVIIVMSEFRLQEEIEIPHVKKMMQYKFTAKFICLYQIFDDTTEAKINLKDMETFILKFFSPLLGADFGKSLVQFCRNSLCEIWDSSNPRTLKELSRSIIRKNLQNSVILTDQVDQFHIPVELKEFILFHCQGIFRVLKESHEPNFIEETIRLLEENIAFYLENF